MFTFIFYPNEIRNFKNVKACDTEKFAAFFNKLLEKGIYFSPSQFEANFISAEHSKHQLDKTLQIIQQALKEIE